MGRRYLGAKLKASLSISPASATYPSDVLQDGPRTLVRPFRVRVEHVVLSIQQQPSAKPIRGVPIQPDLTAWAQYWLRA